MFSSCHLDEVKKLLDGLGPNAHAGEVVRISVTYAALPQIEKDLATELKGKVVLDTCNPITRRDGVMADAARAKGTRHASSAAASARSSKPGLGLVRRHWAPPANGSREGSGAPPGHRFAARLPTNDNNEPRGQHP